MKGEERLGSSPSTHHPPPSIHYNFPMNRTAQLQRVLDCGIVAVVRSPDSQQLVEVVRGPGRRRRHRRRDHHDRAERPRRGARRCGRRSGDRVLLGAGTILDPETARAALLAGAEYIVAPTLNLDVIRLCQRYDKLVMPGAFTPTEILAAWEAGADIVKVFPADVVGPAFFKAVRGPLPQVRLMPTGGVDLKTAAEFLQGRARAASASAASWSSRRRSPRATSTASASWPGSTSPSCSRSAARSRPASASRSAARSVALLASREPDHLEIRSCPTTSSPSAKR